MKKLGAIILILVFVNTIFNYAFADLIDLSVYSDSELVELRDQIDLEISKRNEDKIDELYRVEIENCVLLIDKVYITEDLLERPIFVLNMRFTNYNEDDAYKFTDVFKFSAFQNGVHIHEVFQAIDPTLSYDSEYIKSGATVTLDRGFYLLDLSSPVEMYVSANMARLKHNNYLKGEVLEKLLIPIPTEYNMGIADGDSGSNTEEAVISSQKANGLTTDGKVDQETLMMVNSSDAVTADIALTTVDPETILYYNPSGGKYYHVDKNCKIVGKKYLPLAGQFTYAELNDEAYKELQPCNLCGAPFRDQ